MRPQLWISKFGLGVALILFGGATSSSTALGAIEVLHRFASGSTDGRTPESSLTVVGASLFGTTDYGGSTDGGTLYRYDTGTHAYEVLHHFSAPNIMPVSAPTLVGTKLYGTTYAIGATKGSIYSYDLQSGQFTNLYTMTTAQAPFGGMTQVGSRLYGVTVAGGTGSPGQGTLFSFDLTNNQFTIHHNFSGPDGSVPQGHLTQIGSKLYGTTGEGGAANSGTIFSYDTANNSFASLHSFNGGSGGWAPHAGLTQFGSKLYGTTVIGGNPQFGGTIFSFDPANNAFTKLFNFANEPTEGRSPYGDLTLIDSSFYGMASVGGATGNGTIFKFDPGTNSYTVLHQFDLINGSLPMYALVAMGPKLFGTTLYGGDNNNGVLFSINVPEPGTCALIGAILCVGLRRHRMRRSA